MDSKIAGLIGAVGALASLDPAHAVAATTPDPTEVLSARSYADLLEPIPNAMAALKAIDQVSEQSSGNVEVAQYYEHHHHHHHHNSYYRGERRYAPRIVVVPPRRRYMDHHHHHHHHHNSYYRRDRY